jgi:hypothetical protein
MFKRVMGLIVAAGVMGMTTLVGCGGGEGKSGSGGSGTGATAASGNDTTSGSSGFECCLNGNHFTCPSQSAVEQCVDFNGPDPSACEPDAKPCGNPTSASGDPATTSGGPGATTGSGSDDFGNQCQNNSDCVHNSCLVATGADFGYCTNTCMDFTDCPTFWSCTEVGNATSKYCVQ